MEKSVILTNQALISKKFVDTGALTYTEVIKKIYQNKALDELKKIKNIDEYYSNLLLEYIY